MSPQIAEGATDAERLTQSDATATGDDEAATATHQCPLCEGLAESRDDLYCHLMVSHRKSALSDALLCADGVETRPR